MRLDKYLFEKKFYPSRSKAKAAILCGNVFLNQKNVLEPDYEYNNETISIKPLKYVSRGGIKLNFALNTFDINVKNKTCLDIGCSTGGFSDCLLQNGASFVYGVDVGTNQADQSLIVNDRFQLYEKTHFNDLTNDYFQKHPKIDIVVVDVSFISLTKVLEKIDQLFLNANFECVCLIKPQFELTKSQMSTSKGLAPKKTYESVLNKIKNAAKQFHFKVIEIICSPITGLKKGNKEFLIYLRH